MILVVRWRNWNCIISGYRNSWWQIWTAEGASINKLEIIGKSKVCLIRWNFSSWTLLKCLMFWAVSSKLYSVIVEIIWERCILIMSIHVLGVIVRPPWLKKWAEISLKWRNWRELAYLSHLADLIILLFDTTWILKRKVYYWWCCYSNFSLFFLVLPILTSLFCLNFSLIMHQI